MYIAVYDLQVGKSIKSKFRLEMESNVKAFSVEPNLGFLKPKNKLALLITIISKEHFPERIMIKYSYPLNT